MARRNLFVSASRGRICYLPEPNTWRTKSIAGIFPLSQLPAFLQREIEFVWKSPAVHFLSLIATLEAKCLPARRHPGIGGGRRNPFSTDESALPPCICLCRRRRNDFHRSHPGNRNRERYEAVWQCSRHFEFNK